MSLQLLNILDTPPTFFNILLFNILVKFTLSFFASLFALRSPKPQQHMASFDIDPRTGFFPPKPLPTLSGLFAIWEDALNDARDNLSLGEDDSDQAVAKRPFGEHWRTRIAEVCFFWHCFCSPILNSFF